MYMQQSYSKGELNMFSNNRDAGFKLNDDAPDLSAQRIDTASFAPAGKPEPVVEPDRTVVPATLAIPGPDAVRALLILAAESAFELRNGAQDSMFLVRLKEQSNHLTHTLAALPEVYKGVDCSLLFHRARQSVEILNETIRREILGKINDTTAVAEIETSLRAVKDIAVDAGKALALLGALNSRIR